VVGEDGGRQVVGGTIERVDDGKRHEIRLER